MNDLIKMYELIKSGQIPIWFLLIFFGSIILNVVKVVTPYFEYRLKKYKIEEDYRKESFEKSEKSIGDLKQRRDDFVAYISDLVTKIKDSNVGAADLAKYEIIDNFFDDLMTICDGIEQGFKARNGNTSNIINCVLKHHYNKEDNLIVDAYNAVKIAHSKAGRSFSEPLRIDRYDVLFRVYKSGFPIHKRFIGIFYKKIFDIK